MADMTNAPLYAYSCSKTQNRTTNLLKPIAVKIQSRGVPYDIRLGSKSNKMSYFLIHYHSNV